MAWARAVETASAGDSDAMEPVCGALARARRERPRDLALLRRWARAVSVRLDRLRVAKRWEAMPALRDALLEGAREFPGVPAVELAAAKAARDMMYLWARREELPALERELATLDASLARGESLGAPWRGRLATTWLWGAKVMVCALDDSSWRWGEREVEWLPGSTARLARADALIEAMWAEARRQKSRAGAELVAAAMQGHSWCLRQLKDAAREGVLHDRLTLLAREFRGSRAELEWAHSAGSRALALADEGRISAVMSLAESLARVAARRHGEAAFREAHAKAMSACATAMRELGELDKSLAWVDALAELALRHRGEAMLLRLYALSAKGLTLRAVTHQREALAAGSLRQMERVVSGRHGAGLGRRVLAQTLSEVACAARASGLSRLDARARRRLVALAKRNPGEAEVQRLALDG